ncbi:MAG: type II secretion system protein GspM [Acidobacteria bacterium]|nr:type II secretion system protein GspM [Acidobacteriota bacterium]MCI0623459.1 type II secretion system protein GspM [Acidobacteriota bacterium]MCI0724506.1 type II secretion system protein GspM [Acidobacteriota bacterium]
MKLTQLSKRDRRLLGVAGIALLLYFPLQYFILPYWDAQGRASENIEAKTRQVLKYRKVLLGQDSVKEALKAAQQQTAQQESGLLSSPTDALAGAEVQGILREMVLSKGLTLRRSDALPVRGLTPEYSKVSTRMEVFGNMDQFVNLLVGMEIAPRILYVEEMRLTPVQLNNPRNKQVMATLMVSALKPRVQGS